MDEKAIVEATRRWIANVVIGLDLCPFAGRVFRGGLIRYAVSDARDNRVLLDNLAAELKALVSLAASTIETTLLIHPYALADFLDYNDFLEEADRLIDRLSLRGVIQLASFHPDYRFAGTVPDAPENYSNRSPYPMLHLLREESVTAAAAGSSDLDEIPRRNVELLRRLGRQKILGLLGGLSGKASDD